MTLSSLDRHVSALTQDAIYATRVEVAVRSGSSEWFLDSGPGWVGSISHPGPKFWELFCLAKPFVAFAVLAAAERAGLDATVPLATMHARFSQFDDRLSLSTIVSHSSGLQGPSALSWMCTPAALRPGLDSLDQLEPGQHAYSEVGGAMVLAAWTQLVLGVSLASVLRSELLDPAGVAPEVLLDADSAAECAPDAIQYIVSGLPVASVPMLHLAHPHYRARLGSEFSGLATTSGYLTALKYCLDRGRSGTDQVGHDLFGAERAPRHDSTWQRETAFRGPFLSEACGSADGLWVLSALTGSFVFVDLDTELCLVAMLNGGDLGPEDARALRIELVAAVQEDLR